MAYEVQDKVVLITGAATGIGAKVVRYLLKDGAKFVAALDINEDAGISLQNELNSKHDAERVKFIKCDVSDERQLLEAFRIVLESNGNIDIVINNAGIMNDKKEIYKKSIEVNVTALTISTLRALEIMRKDCGGNGGTVINIASTAALVQGPELPVYLGTKSFVLQFSNCIGLPVNYSRTGVRVVTVCFGPTDTALLSTEKFGSFDKVAESNLVEVLKAVQLQSADSAAVGVIDACKKGESGSTWLVVDDQPAKDITDIVKKGYEIFSSVVPH